MSSRAAWLAIFAGTVLGQEGFRVTPSVRQGETIEIEAPPGQFKARLGTLTVPLFAEKGRSVGVLPVVVTHPPGVHRVTILGEGGRVAHEAKITVADAKYPIQNIAATKAMKALGPLPGEMEAMTALHRSVTPERKWSRPFGPPVPDCRNSSFGVLRYHNGKASGNYHRGLDLLSPAGRPVKAAAAGTVKVARMWRMHGGTVGIDHGQGVTTHYLHLSKIAAQEGQEVRQGDVVGFVGATGFATGPHLHWGLYVFGVPVNPVQWAPAVPRCQ